MELFDALGPLMTALGHALLHFLWQGAVIAVLTLVALKGVPRRNSGLRHGLGVGALVVSLVAFVGTFALTLAGGDGVSAGAGAMLIERAMGAGERSVEAGSSAAAALDFRRLLATAWVLGVLLTAWRCKRGCAWAWGLKRTAVVPQDETWQRMVDSLGETLGLKRAVRLLQSTRIDSPAVIGWLKPVIVVPVTALTGLSPEQLRCVLAHELAHIQRKDHLVNALLALIEVTLFFHPAVWWLMRLVREEREYCCDQTAVHATGNPRLLARALTELETLRLTDPAPVLAARSDHGPLMQRVTQILAMNPTNTPRDAGRLLSPAFIMIGLLACAGAVQSAVAQPVSSLPGTDTAVPSQEGGERKRQRSEEHSKRTEEKKRSERRTAEAIKGRIAEVLARTDANKDGVVSQAEAGEMWARLATADANKDGMLTSKEMYKAWSSTGNDKRLEKRERSRLIKEELEAMVAAGKMTEAQAKERFAAWKKKLAIQADRAKASELVLAKLEAAVAAGKITKEEAKLKYGAWRKALAENGEVRSEPSIESMIKEVQAAVEAGKLTPAQGKEKIEGLRKRMSEKKAAAANKKVGYADLLKKLEAQVAAGTLTSEQAKKELELLRRKMAERTRTPKDS